MPCGETESSLILSQAVAGASPAGAFSSLSVSSFSRASGSEPGGAWSKAKTDNLMGLSLQQPGRQLHTLETKVRLLPGPFNRGAWMSPPGTQDAEKKVETRIARWGVTPEDASLTLAG